MFLLLNSKNQIGLQNKNYYIKRLILLVILIILYNSVVAALSY